MLRSAVLGSVAILFFSSYCMGQGAVQAVRGAADRLVEGKDKLTNWAGRSIRKDQARGY